VINRRTTQRSALHGVLLNKYVGGFPYAVSLVDLSETGIRVRSLIEPETSEKNCAIELEVPGTGDRLWLWAREVWRSGKKQALTFSGLTSGDRAMIRALMSDGEVLSQ